MTVKDGHKTLAGMYGKAFESMYEGSMIGAGCNVFAVWNYIIAKNRCGVVELNPKLLGFVLGATQEEVEKAVEYLCRPDSGSRSKLEDGRRLLREGEYQFRMVNWEYYDRIKSKEALREYNARKQAEYRARQSHTSKVQQEKNEARRKTKADKEAKAAFQQAS